MLKYNGFKNKNDEVNLIIYLKWEECVKEEYLKLKFEHVEILKCI